MPNEPDATPGAISKAEELGVDLNSVEGTGKDGKILVEDVEQAAGSAEEQAPAEKEIYVFNKKTEIVGYTFPDKRKFTKGVRYALTPEDVEKYAKTKVNGHQVLVKE